MLSERINPYLGGKLAALIGIDYLGDSMPCDGLLQRAYAPFRIHGVTQAPTHYVAGVQVDYSKKVHITTLHGDICDINRPYLIGRLVCFFAYAIIKEMENRILPFLKTYNKEKKVQLSFNDIIQELNNIKICELQIGKREKSLACPDLNPLQERIFSLFSVNSKDMITQQLISQSICLRCLFSFHYKSKTCFNSLLNSSNIRKGRI